MYSKKYKSKTLNLDTLEINIMMRIKMLKTKCILAQSQTQDGIRVSIMSRHTLNDGVTPDTRIMKDMYDVHCPNLAPSVELVGKFYKREISFEQYRKKYIAYLNTKKLSRILQKIARYAADEDITFLCIEAEYTFCHRYIFAQECIKYVPKLSKMFL